MDDNSKLPTETDESLYVPMGKYREMQYRVAHLEVAISELQDLTIWMTGCGYDFCQHEFFVKRRHILAENHDAMTTLKKVTD